MAEDQDIKQIYEHSSLYQLRRIGTRFDNLDTYQKMRAINPMLLKHSLFPHTVFTFADNGNGNDGTDGRIASELLAEIATSILNNKNHGQHGQNVGRLEKHTLQKLSRELNETGKSSFETAPAYASGTTLDDDATDNKLSKWLMHSTIVTRRLYNEWQEQRQIWSVCWKMK